MMTSPMLDLHRFWHRRANSNSRWPTPWRCRNSPMERWRLNLWVLSTSSISPGSSRRAGHGGDVSPGPRLWVRAARVVPGDRGPDAQPHLPGHRSVFHDRSTGLAFPAGVTACFGRIPSGRTPGAWCSSTRRDWSFPPCSVSLPGAERQINWVAFLGALAMLCLLLPRQRRLVVAVAIALFAGASLLTLWFGAQPNTASIGATSGIKDLIQSPEYLESICINLYLYFILCGIFLLPLTISTLAGLHWRSIRCLVRDRPGLPARVFPASLAGFSAPSPGPVLHSGRCLGPLGAWI